ncbi:MAG: YihY/virulence factor BrkB family protein [Planctomycetota bacterium]
MLHGSQVMKGFFQFHAKNGSYYAAAIAFYLLFAATPFLMLSLTIAAYVASDASSFLEILNAWIKANVPPVAQPLKESLASVFANRHQIGIVGGIWLFLSARKLVGAIEIGLNAMLDVEKPKSGVLTTIASVAFIFVAALMFLAAMLVLLAIDFASGIDFSLVGTEASSILAMLAKIAVGGAAWVGIFFAIYKLAPARSLEKRDALFAAITASLMFTAARLAFTWYGAKQLAQYQVLYGAVASLLMVLLFAYFFGISLLMGACMVRKK